MERNVGGWFGRLRRFAELVEVVEGERADGACEVSMGGGRVAVGQVWAVCVALLGGKAASGEEGSRVPIGSRKVNRE